MTEPRAGITAMTKSTVLIISTDPEASRVIAGSLNQREFDVAMAPTPAQALTLASDSLFELAIVMEPVVSNGNHPSIIRSLRELSPSTEIIISARRPTFESAFEGIQESVYDYLCLPSDLDRLPLAARQAVSAHRRRMDPGDVTRHEAFAPHEHCACALIGASPAIVEARRHIVEWAVADAPILICGEQGVGKDLVARLIHEVSARHGMGPFTKVSCESIPESEFESEFFGHVRGASTGPVPQKPGRLELADDGTLFLDRIERLPFEIQSRVLDILDQREFTRLGGSMVFRMDAQVVAAVASSTGERILPDLLARFAPRTITLPPLRERREDVPLLCRHFLDTLAVKHGLEPRSLPPHIMDRLLQYAWPENVRELEIMMTRFAFNGKASH